MQYMYKTNITFPINSVKVAFQLLSGWLKRDLFHPSIAFKIINNHDYLSVLLKYQPNIFS